MNRIQQGFTLIELMIVVAIIGILAAVAIPSYQDYTARAQVSEGLSLTSAFKTTLAEYYADNGGFDALSFSALGGTTSGKYVAGVDMEAGAVGGTVAVVATFKTSQVASQIQGSVFPIGTTNGGKEWFCGSLVTGAGITVTGTLVDDKLVPGSCK